MSAVGKPIGGVGFISAPITSPQQMYAHLRRAERKDFRGAAPTDEKITRDKAYLNHDTARAAATRRGKPVFHTAEQVNARAIAAAQAAAQAQGRPTDDAPALAELATLRAALSAQEAVSRAQAETIERLVIRLDALDGNPDGVIGLNGNGT